MADPAPQQTSRSFKKKKKAHRHLFPSDGCLCACTTRLTILLPPLRALPLANFHQWNLHLKANITGEEELTSFPSLLWLCGKLSCFLFLNPPEPYVEKEKEVGEALPPPRADARPGRLPLPSEPAPAGPSPPRLSRRTAEHQPCLSAPKPEAQLTRASTSGFPGLAQGGAITELRLKNTTRGFKKRGGGRGVNRTTWPGNQRGRPHPRPPDRARGAGIPQG